MRSKTEVKTVQSHSRDSHVRQSNLIQRVAIDVSAFHKFDAKAVTAGGVAFVGGPHDTTMDMMIAFHVVEMNFQSQQIAHAHD
ncbi:MAG: hypothetical protein AB7F86_18065 [Bdellovibrionales bacterium]